MSKRTQNALNELDAAYRDGQLHKWDFWDAVFALFEKRRCTLGDIAAVMHTTRGDRISYNLQYGIVEMRLADWRGMGGSR